MSIPNWILFIFFLTLGSPQFVLAYQDAKVTQHNAKVYEAPDSASSLLSRLKRGQAIKASSKWVTDGDGFNWYKVFVEGRFGYILANSLETSAIRRDLAGIKIESAHILIPDGRVRSWSFLLRGMVKVSDIQELGSETEFSYTLPFSSEGTWRHLISLGVVYSKYIVSEPVLLGTLIFRVPLEWRLKPEIRIRAGQSLSNELQVGGTLGFQYPFSLHFGAHLSAYGEMGSMLSVSAMVYHLFGAVGLGFHF